MSSTTITKITLAIGIALCVSAAIVSLDKASKIDVVIDKNPPLQTHLVEVDHPKWLEAYDCNDLDVMQTYNIALIRAHLARTMAKVAALDPNGLGSTEK